MNTLVNTSVSTILSTLPETFRDLSEEQLKQVVLLLKLDDYKSQVKSEIVKERFDLDAVTSVWLKDKAMDTVRMYKLYLNDFIDYLNGISLLDVNNYAVDQYITTTLSNYSRGKARLVFASLSSFYSLLCRYEHIDRNPWKGAVLKSTMVIPEIKYLLSESDIKSIYLNYNLDSKADKKMRLVIYIMLTYGVRVGFFNKEISYDGKHLSSVSKGKYYKVNVENDLVILENADLLTELNKNSIASSFNRVINKMYKNEDILHKYSLHDMRHTFACKEYTKDKDIYRVSKALHHSNIVITETYLKGLEVM